MPLKSGSSQATISSNIGEMVRSARAKGKIGNVPTRSASKAREVAAAIAYKKSREGKAKKAAGTYRAREVAKKARKG